MPGTIRVLEPAGNAQGTQPRPRALPCKGQGLVCLLHTPFPVSPLFLRLGSTGEGEDGLRDREMGWVLEERKGLCSCGSVSSEGGRESRRGCVRGQEGAGGAGAHSQAMGCTEVLEEVCPSSCVHPPASILPCPFSLMLRPEGIKGWRVKTPLPPSQTHSRELLSAGEKHNKAPKNRAEGEGAGRAWGSQPHAGFCTSPAASHPSKSAQTQHPAAARR